MIYTDPFFCLENEPIKLDPGDSKFLLPLLNSSPAAFSSPASGTQVEASRKYPWQSPIPHSPLFTLLQWVSAALGVPTEGACYANHFQLQGKWNGVFL